MKLHRKRVPLLCRGRERFAILADRHRLLDHRGKVRMGVVHKAVVRNSVQQTRSPRETDLVPTNMRDARVSREAKAISREAPQSRYARSLLTPLEHPLQSNTNSEERLPLRDCLTDRRRHTSLRDDRS